MSGPSIHYVSMDSLGDGVASSQVVPYVERLRALGHRMVVHSFERFPVDVAMEQRLQVANVDWRPHEWGRSGPLGGLVRTVRSSRYVRGARLVHARGDLAAAAATLDGDRPWIWDMRAFFREQRIEQGSIRPTGIESRVLQRLEERLARTADAIIVLARAAVPVLRERHGDSVADRCEVIPTCADLSLFDTSAAPARPTRVAMVGTLNDLYDVPLMIALTKALARVREVQLVAAVPRPSRWDEELDRAADERVTLRPADMPRFLRTTHVGLAILRSNLGPSVKGAMPTKLGEFLASGRPVVVSAGLGDMDAIIQQWRCGVSVGETSADALRAKATELDDLLGDPELVERCRAAATKHFDLEDGVRKLSALYERALS